MDAEAEDRLHPFDSATSCPPHHPARTLRSSINGAGRLPGQAHICQRSFALPWVALSLRRTTPSPVKHDMYTSSGLPISQFLHSMLEHHAQRPVRLSATLSTPSLSVTQPTFLLTVPRTFFCEISPWEASLPLGSALSRLSAPTRLGTISHWMCAFKA